MNDSDRNNPKPLPDDFGMTIPNMRLPKQNQGSESDLPTTNLRNAPPPAKNSYNAAPQQQPPSAPADDFGMTVPNLRSPIQQQQSPQTQQPPPVNDFDQTAPNIRASKQNSPSEPDFGMTLNNFQPQNSTEPDYGATMSYIPAVTPPPRNTHREEVREVIPPVLPNLHPRASETRRKGVPLWGWLLGGGAALLLLLTVVGVAAYLLIPRNSGFTLVLKFAPAGSNVYLDGASKGVTRGDGSITIDGIEAEKKRLVKVTKENCTDFNDTVLGENGETKELTVQMKCGATPAPDPPKIECEEKDQRVCGSELAALDALDKLVPPFTVDDWVKAMNLQIVNFESNSADVPPARKKVLEKGAAKFKLLTGNPGVEVGGHTDNVGNDVSNQKLSESRAQSVRIILVNNGVNAKAFTTRGYGSKKPADGNPKSNDTENGRFNNRRIQYTVTSR